MNAHLCQLDWSPSVRSPRREDGQGREVILVVTDLVLLLGKHAIDQWMMQFLEKNNKIHTLLKPRGFFTPAAITFVEHFLQLCWEPWV